MAALFQDFSFEAASRHPSSTYAAERAAMNVSPTSRPCYAPPELPTRLPTPPPCPVGELAERFDEQSLRVQVDPAFQSRTGDEPVTPPSDDFAFPLEQPAPSYSRISTAALRMQRQANTRIQCNPSHIKDISILVQKMIEDEDQCNVCDSKSPTPSSSSSDADEDEGVDMDYRPSSPRERYPLKFRRSGERLNGAAVSKAVRMRKKSGVLKKSSR